MYLGIALTQHCNLRCPHCIRDDVRTVVSIDAALVERVVDEVVEMFGPMPVSFTGGEPTIHPEWDRIVAAMHERGVPYRFVTNGWHMRRLVPSLDRHPPSLVRVSLSGATAAVHDAERGRGSFRRVLLAVAILTSRRIPTGLSIVVDGRDRHQVRAAIDLAEGLGCTQINLILPQPVPASAARGSDLPPGEWLGVRREIEAIGREPGRATRVALDYGAPFEGEEAPCDAFALRRVYIDARGRLSLCCQLNEYGFNDADVVADLYDERLPDVWPRYLAALDALRASSRRRVESGDAFDAFPCMRCARASGKLTWLADHPTSPWAGAARPHSA